MTDKFDSASGLDDFDDEVYAPAPDPLRPEAGKSGYPLPHPVTGKRAVWPRTSNLIKLVDDTYHLELWKQRNVAKGTAMLLRDNADLMSVVADSDVKRHKARLDKFVKDSMSTAGADAMAVKGTDLHKATELADMNGGDLSVVPEQFRRKVRDYLDALQANGLTVVPGMVERRVVSTFYGVAGTFDRIYRLADGSYVIGDLKTSASDMFFAMPAIESQLATYEEAVNTHGVFDGSGYDKRIKVRKDFGLVIHMPSTRDGITVRTVDLTSGHSRNVVNMSIRDERKRGVGRLTGLFDPSKVLSVDESDNVWLERLNACTSFPELVTLADDAREVGQWNERLANQARKLSKGLPAA